MCLCGRGDGVKHPTTRHGTTMVSGGENGVGRIFTSWDAFLRWVLRSTPPHSADAAVAAASLVFLRGTYGCRQCGEVAVDVRSIHFPNLGAIFLARSLPNGRYKNKSTATSTNGDREMDGQFKKMCFRQNGLGVVNTYIQRQEHRE